MTKKRSTEWKRKRSTCMNNSERNMADGRSENERRKKSNLFSIR